MAYRRTKGTIKTVILEVNRMPSSTYGNPRFSVRTEAGWFSTEPDSGIAYGLENTVSVGESGVPAVIHYEETPKNRYILGIRTSRPPRRSMGEDRGRTRQEGTIPAGEEWEL